MNKRTIIIILILIAVISIGLKLSLVDFSIPVHNDDLHYSLRAIAHTEGDFSQSPRKGSGWPIFASVFYSMIDSPNFMDYSNALRILSMAVSTITILPMYGLARKYFDEKYSLVAASLFAFEPHLIYNAGFGFAEPLYLFLIVLSLYFILNKNEKFAFVSFAITGLVFWTRIEGFIVFFAISIIYFINFRKKSNTIPKYLLCVFIFLLVISPIFIIRGEQYSDPFYFYFGQHIFVENQYEYGDSIATVENYVEEKSYFEFIYNFIILGIIHIIQLLISISFPYLIFLLPIGLFLSIRSFDQNSLYVKSNWIFFLSTLAILVIPLAVIPERRFLFYLIPSLIIFSVIPIQRLIEYGLSTFSLTSREKHLCLIGIVIVIIILSGIFTLRYDNINSEKEHELIDLAEFLVYELDGQIMLDRTYDKYMIFAKINESPNIFKDYRISFERQPYGASFPYDVSKQLVPISGNSINEVLEIGKNFNVKYLVLDNNNKFDFLDEIYHNETNYENLEKVFDSKEQGYKHYSIKIFKLP